MPKLTSEKVEPNLVMMTQPKNRPEQKRIGDMTKGMPQSSESSAEEFRELCLLYASIVKAGGVQIDAYDPQTLPDFLAKPIALQRKAIRAITQDILILESMQGARQSLRDSRTHLWRFIAKMGWTPQSDIFDKIEDEDTVEVYVLEPSGQCQIFRNLRFLECVSFTIEQLYGIDWKFATKHEPAYAQEIIGAVGKCLSSPQAQTWSFSRFPHHIQELDSPKRLHLSICLKYLSPLTSAQKIEAFICTNRTTVLSSGA